MTVKSGMIEESICIRLCYDPDAQESEYREYNYVATVVYAGYRRDKFFDELEDAWTWAYDKLLHLRAKAAL